MECKSLKEEKFNSIYRAHVDSVLKVAMYYTKDYDTAQEITQMTFFKLYTHFDNVDLEYIQPWLITTTRNLIYNHNRDLKREILGEAMELLMKSKNVICHTESMEEYYLRKEKNQRAEELSISIFEKLYKKNPQWHEAIMLVYCLGKSQQEAADEMGIAIEVLNSRLYRARKWIRKNYEKKYEKVSSWFYL